MKFLLTFFVLALGAAVARAEPAPQRPGVAWHGHWHGGWRPGYGWPRYGGWRGPGYGPGFGPGFGYTYTCYAESGYGQIFGAYSPDPYLAQNLALQACFYSSGGAGCVALGCR